MEDDEKAKVLALSEQRKMASHSTSCKVSINAHYYFDVRSSPRELEEVLITMVTKHSNRASKPSSHYGDVRSVMSQPNKATIKAAKAQVMDEEIKINRHLHIRHNDSHMIYSIMGRNGWHRFKNSPDSGI